MPSIGETQRIRNEQSRECWELFAEHRARISELLRPSEASGGLLLLGAGNCNDVDLANQLSQYSHIALADIDRQALEYGLQRQAIAQRDRIELLNYDATGLLARLETWHAQPPSDEEIRSALQQVPASSRPWNPRSFATSASLCLVSQLVDALQFALGRQHPLLLEAIATVRQHHLRALVDSTQDGGRAVVVLDFVSSDTLPQIDTCPAEQFSSLIRAALSSGNFFTGLNPRALAQAAAHDPHIAPRLRQIQLASIWRWNLGPRRYAVCGIVLELREDPQAVTDPSDSSPSPLRSPPSEIP